MNPAIASTTNVTDQEKIKSCETHGDILLIQHILRARRISELLESARQAHLAYMEVIHRLPFGVVLLDNAANPLEVSRCAQELLRNGLSLYYKRNRIHAAHTDDDRHLQRAIFDALTARIRESVPDSTISVRRQQCDRRPLHVTVTPVGTTHFFASSAPRCMLIIFDPESLPMPAVELVKRTLQITEAEALLACEIFKGVSLRETAEQLGLSINTCKTQLKSIYAKTGCRSHVDLAKMLATIGLKNRI